MNTSQISSRRIETACRVLAIGAVGAGVGLWLAARPALRAEPGHRPERKPAADPSPVAPLARAPDPADWTVFEAEGGAAAVPAANTPAGRFRLAGTFFTYPEGPGTAVGERKAVLDDAALPGQRIVREGDRLGEAVRVERIHADRIVLVSGADAITLRLSAPDAADPGSPVLRAESAPGPGEDPEHAAPLESTRFGDRVSSDRWMLRRDALMEYYRDMLDEPERIARLYETFRPDYANGEIAGYRLDILGEHDFLAAMGLRENDVIRYVNSMRMSSRHRAEYFLREFVQDRISAIVLEVERDGELTKQVYLIR